MGISLQKGRLFCIVGLERSEIPTPCSKVLFYRPGLECEPLIPSKPLCDSCHPGQCIDQHHSGKSRGPRVGVLGGALFNSRPKRSDPAIRIGTACSFNVRFAFIDPFQSPLFPPEE